MKTELLYFEPRFPNGCGVNFPKRILKGRYMLPPDIQQSVYFLFFGFATKKGQDC